MTGDLLAGDQIAFDITVSNIGDGVARDVTLTDTLPSGVTFVSAVPGQGSCGDRSTASPPSCG